MWFLKMIGILVAWTVAGTILGFALSILLATLLGFYSIATMDGPRSPGNDPMQVIGMLWGMLIAPAFTLGGACGGFVIGCSRSGAGRSKPTGSLLAVGMLVMLAGCSSEIVSGPDYPHKERAVAEIALASVGAAPVETPDDGQLGKCPQCNGTGTVGDGRTATKCMKCGGDGRIDEEDLRQGSTPVVEAAPSEAGTITLHITDVTKRGWPETWWLEEKPILEADGWIVAVEKHAIEEQQAAMIEVCIGEKCWPFFGPITLKNVSHLKEQ